MRVGDAVITVRRRRVATRLAVFAASLAVLTCVPGAIALNQMVGTVTVDSAVTTDSTTIESTPVVEAPTLEPAPVLLAPVEPVIVEFVIVEPAPVEPAPVAAAPPAEPQPAPVEPAAVVEPAPPAQPTPDPVPLSAVTEPTPAAPQEVIVAVQDAPAVSAGEAPATTTTDPAPVAPSGDPVDLGTLASMATAVDSVIAPERPATESPLITPLITPLVVPIVQRLGAGLLLPYMRPQAFGPPPPFGTVIDAASAMASPRPSHPPAEATHVAADLPFGFAAPPGGWTDDSAGILALLMGFLPLGLPDGKSSLTQETQTALILMGALLAVLPFFAASFRDRRRRGPRGFATLALRPG